MSEPQDLRYRTLVDEIVECTLDMIPPDIDGKEAGSLLFVAALGVAARALVLSLSASSEKELRAIGAVRAPYVGISSARLHRWWHRHDLRVRQQTPPIPARQESDPDLLDRAVSIDMLHVICKTHKGRACDGSERVFCRPGADRRGSGADPRR